MSGPIFEPSPARRRRAWRRIGPLLLAVTLVAANAGCGVPSDRDVTVISTGGVPYDLLNGRQHTSSFSSVPGNVLAQIAFIRDGRVRLVTRSVAAGPALRTAQALLDQLALGPSDAERNRGLDSAVPAGEQLKVSQVVNGDARVSIPADMPAPAAGQLPLTVAQVVFTATSAHGVYSITLERDGQHVDAPLANGSLTSAPLRRRDFYALLGPAPPVTPSPTTPSGGDAGPRSHEIEPGH